AVDESKLGTGRRMLQRLDQSFAGVVGGWVAITCTQAERLADRLKSLAAGQVQQGYPLPRRERLGEVGQRILVGDRACTFRRLRCKPELLQICCADALGLQQRA